LLQKIQICKINEKDIKDVMILLREHQIGETDKESVNVGYISKLLSRDWGFWFSAVTNLKKTREFLADYKALKDTDQKDIETKIAEILKALEDEPKSVQWKLRSKIGTSKKWYTEVEELIRYG
jgi:hypothetical protein